MAGPHMSGTCDLTALSIRMEEEYGFRIKKIDVADEDSYLITVKDGTLHAVRTDDKEARVLFITGIYEYIRERKFHNILKTYRTRTGKYYIHSRDGIYMVYECSGKNSISMDEDYKDIVELLARFHRAARGYVPPSGGKAKSCWGQWIETQGKECRNIKCYRDKIMEKGDDKTPFEVMFLSSCEEYLGRMERSISLMKKGGYLDSVEQSMRNHQVCLGCFKQSNFYKTRSGINIKALDKCRYDMVEWDIAELFDKLSEIKVDDLKQQAMSLINIYSRENTLLDNSVNIIKAFLLYPGEYEKISSKKHRGKDKWNEGEYMEKLKCAMEMDDRRAKVADALG